MKTVIVVNEMDAQGNAVDITIYGNVVPVGMFRNCSALAHVTLGRSDAGPITEAYKAATEKNAELRNRCKELQAENECLSKENEKLRNRCVKLEDDSVALRRMMCSLEEKVRILSSLAANREEPEWLKRLRSELAAGLTNTN